MRSVPTVKWETVVRWLNYLLGQPREEQRRHGNNRQYTQTAVARYNDRGCPPWQG